LRKLAAQADVLVEGFRPGVMKRLGADYDTLAADNPRLVYCSLSGLGQDGPYRDFPAHDINYLSLAGVLNQLGQPDEPPTIPLNLVADYGGASMHGALGVMFALFARERTGRGQLVDVAYLDATISLLAAVPPFMAFFGGGPEPRRGLGTYDGSRPFYTTYECADGKLLSIGCTEPHLWHNFCDVVDRPDLKSAERLAGEAERGRGDPAVSRRDEERLEDVLAATRAISGHLRRGGLDDGLVFDAVRVRLIEIGEAVKSIDPSLLARTRSSKPPSTTTSRRPSPRSSDSWPCSTSRRGRSK
jgi:alpha-methylacyl-CoA racemase